MLRARPTALLRLLLARSTASIRPPKRISRLDEAPCSSPLQVGKSIFRCSATRSQVTESHDVPVGSISPPYKQ
jgi:hypothetical protein